MLSKTGIHAVRAMAALARLRPGEYAGAGAIAEAIRAPRNYLGKLLQTLAREGLVESQKGLGGGFRLARAPETITLLDVVEPIEHVGRWNRCILGNPECSGERPCAIHHQWKEVRAKYVDMLRGANLANLNGFEGMD